MERWNNKNNNLRHGLKRYEQGKECVRMNLNNQQDNAWSPNKMSQFINNKTVKITRLKSEQNESNFSKMVSAFIYG